MSKVRYSFEANIVPKPLGQGWLLDLGVHEELTDGWWLG